MAASTSGIVLIACSTACFRISAKACGEVARASDAAASTAQNLTRDNVPKVLGEMLLYGKETDRPARIVVVRRVWEELTSPEF